MKFLVRGPFRGPAVHAFLCIGERFPIAEGAGAEVGGKRDDQWKQHDARGDRPGRHQVMVGERRRRKAVVHPRSNARSVWPECRNAS